MMKYSERDKDFSKIYNYYRLIVEKQLKLFNGKRIPDSVYSPIKYILSSGGKRFRPILVILACEAVGGKLSEAIYAAAAIEMLHNFTLVHDDIMDHAELRRGRLTVHKKWDENTAILAGDEMIAQAYKVLLRTKSPALKQVLQVYTDAFVQVCEGQGMDKEFESKKNVSLADYFKMISKKTGRVISASTEIGGIIGGGTKKQLIALRKYGEYLGKAFQIMDDLLDLVGNTKELGKKIGGDIKEGKKTYLLIKAMEKVRGSDRKLLFSISPSARVSEMFVNKAKKIYFESGVVADARKEVLKNTRKAQQAIALLPSSNAKSLLMWLPEQFLERTS
jgi:geranylgeranyl diphosphate synthase type II